MIQDKFHIQSSIVHFIELRFTTELNDVSDRGLNFNNVSIAYRVRNLNYGVSRVTNPWAARSESDNTI